MAKRKKANNKKKTKKTTKKAAKKVTKKTSKKTVKKTAKKATKKITKKAVKKPARKAIKKLGPVSAPQVQVGGVVPDFEAPATGMQSVKLSDFRGKKLILFFYPKDSTPGCTIEGHDFSNLKGNFEIKNVVVYGVSRDSLTSHENFKSKQNYSVDLISDSDEKLCKIFGTIKNKNMYGKIVQGLDRSTFVIDESGRLIKEWRGVKVDGHAQEVLDYINSL